MAENTTMAMPKIEFIENKNGRGGRGTRHRLTTSLVPQSASVIHVDQTNHKNLVRLGLPNNEHSSRVRIGTPIIGNDQLKRIPAKTVAIN
jgi:hypothetical protein